ncbi:hypothetical protein [Rhizobacter sp. P5_C2]
MFRCFKSPRSRTVAKDDEKQAQAPIHSRKNEKLKREAALTVRTAFETSTSSETDGTQSQRSATVKAASAIAAPISQVINGATVKILDKLIAEQPEEQDPVNFIKSVQQLSEDEFTALLEYSGKKLSPDVSGSSPIDRRKGDFLRQILPKGKQIYRLPITATYLHYLLLRDSSLELSAERIGPLSRGDLTAVSNFMRDLEKRMHPIKLNLGGQKNLGDREAKSICESLSHARHRDVELNLSNTGLSRQDRVAFESLLALDITRIMLEGNGLTDQDWLWKAIYSKTSLHPKHIYLGSMSLDGDTKENIDRLNGEKCRVHVDKQ